MMISNKKRISPFWKNRAQLRVAKFTTLEVGEDPTACNARGEIISLECEVYNIVFF